MTALADALDSQPMTVTAPLGYHPRAIVLLGAGPVHLHLLRHLAKHPIVGAIKARIPVQRAQLERAYGYLMVRFLQGVQNAQGN